MARELRLTLEERLRPEHTALIVVDMQNDYCATGGYVESTRGNVRSAQAMVGTLQTCISEARRVGMLILFIQTFYDLQYLSAPMLVRNQSNNLDSLCIRGTWGAEFYEVDPAPEDEVVIKHRYSAFQGTNLDLLLRNRGIETLVLTGVSTNVCVESTARDGYFLNYYIAVVKDCTASPFDDLHNATLKNVEIFFGDVVTCHQLIEIWKQ